MTKLFVVLFFLASILSNFKAEAQVDPVTGQYVDNGNILLSPGAESGVKGWTNSAGTFTVESTGAIVGKRLFKVVLSSQTLNLSQDSAKYASEYADGVQLLASVKVKTSVSGVKLCARKAGVVQTSLCASHTGSGKWEHLKVPFISSATSNGLAIVTDTAKTGTIYVDDAFVGAVDLSATQSFDTTCDTIACATEFSSYVSIGGGHSRENFDFISSCTNPSTGIFNCTFNSSVFSAIPNCTGVAMGGSGAPAVVYFSNSTTTTLSISIRNTSNALQNADFQLICQRSNLDYATALQAQKDYQKTKVSSYSSTNADTDWQLATAPTIFGSTTNPVPGTVSYNQMRWKRSGGDLELRWQYKQTTAGTVGSGNYYIELPNGLQIDTNRISNLNPTGFEAFVGSGTMKSASTLFNANVQISNNSTNRLSIQLSNEQFTPTFWSSTFASLANVSVDLSIYVKVPIQGWENSNIIIGQFNGLESCTDTLECTDVFSARISSAGVVSDENVDWINGNASSAVSGANQRYTINFNSSIFTVGPNCSVTVLNESVAGGAQLTCNMPSITSTGVITSCSRQDGASEVATPLNHLIICQKQGADYIGKTAKAVASDQNIATPGVTKIKSCYVRYSGSASDVTTCSSSPCTVREDTCGGASVTMPVTAEYVLTFPAGEFAPNSYIYCSATGTRQDTDQNMWYTSQFESTSQSFKSGSDGSFRHRFGFYNGGSYSYNFGNIKCEGKAP